MNGGRVDDDVQPSQPADGLVITERTWSRLVTSQVSMCSGSPVLAASRARPSFPVASMPQARTWLPPAAEARGDCAANSCRTRDQCYFSGKFLHRSWILASLVVIIIIAAV